MKNFHIKILPIILILLSTQIMAEEDNNNDTYDDGRSYTVPLAPEMRETYAKGKEHGKPIGEWTRELFCENFGWTWFCD